MKILLVADIHGNRKRSRKLFEKYGLREFDLVIINGDVTQFQGIDAAEETISILSRIGKNTVFVPGNCDPPQLLEKEKIGDAINIHGKNIIFNTDIGDLEFIGIGGSTHTPFNTWIEFSEEEIYRMLPTPESKSILVSHTPPLDTNIDKIWIGKHVGSRIIREYILEHKPILGLHAHIHEAKGTDRVGDTIVVNPGPLQNGYYAVVSLDKTLDISVKLLRV